MRPINRGDRDAQRVMEARRPARRGMSIARVFGPALLVCLYAISSLSCGTKPTDMRQLVPADSLAYLETNDLAAALQPVIDSRAFTAAAKARPDLSPLKGVQLAVAVTGFEVSEEKVSDENSVGRVQPRFVAVADTHAWNFQAVRFAEQRLGAFVSRIYDAEPTLEKNEREGGTYFTWSAGDGRKAHALVIGSVVYFANDESAIDKALAVRRGDADSIAKTDKLSSASPQTLARGHISREGVAQTANIISVMLAASASEDAELRTAIATVMPQELRTSIDDVSWTMTKAERGIEDIYVIGRPAGAKQESSPLLEELASSLIEDIQETNGRDVAAALGIEAGNADGANTVYRQENRFSDNTVERHTVTDLGFIGWMVVQLSEE